MVVAIVEVVKWVFRGKRTSSVTEEKFAGTGAVFPNSLRISR
jgi:hypothetical protein